ncbi:MAG: N-acetylmuramoyl-L-alanine amidase [Verrucomicrobiales bacterium]|nr:N-acetylmuramoyl-L-alanine amidase [Verrucomicrobiales bacterium]MCP5558029.1 N-acetylmuramoyl-L-alanine amidase [Verrucomicrobiaceae bacterium]
MIKRIPINLFQHLSLVVTGMAILTMLAPLRSSVHSGHASLASAIPLLTANAVADSRAFHSINFAKPTQASAAPQFRLPDPTESRGDRPQRAILISKRVTPLPVDFRAPRTRWDHLPKSLRNQIDAQLDAASVPIARITLHGSGMARGDARQMDRLRRMTHQAGAAAAHHFVIGNGTDSTDGSVQMGERWSDAVQPDGTLHLCLVGDFTRAGPTAEQLEALDELVDYLTLKTGRLEVGPHQSAEHTARCLGPFFPVKLVVHALSKS